MWTGKETHAFMYTKTMGKSIQNMLYRSHNFAAVWYKRQSGFKNPKEKSWDRNSGVTLAEILLSMVVIGTILTFALPRYTGTLEKARSTEGVELLRILAEATRIYMFENPDYDPYAPDHFGNLDIELPSGAKHFDIEPIQLNADPPIRVSRKTGKAPEDYTRSILDCENFGSFVFIGLT